MNCFSGTIRPALTMVRESRGERGCGAIGSGLGTTTISGAVAPSSARSHDAVDSVSSATAAARGAKASSGSIPPTRSADERCSWWHDGDVAAYEHDRGGHQRRGDGDQHVDVEVGQRGLEPDVGERGELPVPAGGDEPRGLAVPGVVTAHVDEVLHGDRGSIA